ncbi:hypothetical protein [Acinetobacter ursingii]|uniref:hypothetical protein n=1 Tax=Acinetobacter ursingii TaxID=108980 RepID=UPI0012500154|nr:hypothetical protein [Acinetobacter ursingii]MCU4483651.1 hypothetical protein [Acinetobacter ursingii]MCU4507971.1 hypothetical protein [Acinetobacter ursingii]
MIEILFICLVIWILYAWKTGKFSKESKEKNRAELKRDWNQLKQDFKVGFKKSESKPDDDRKDDISKPILTQKQRELEQKKRIKHAEELAKKHGTRSDVIDEEKRELQAQIDYEYTLKLLGKSGTLRYNDDDTIYRSLPKISNYRYVLEYRDASGSVTIRGIDITRIHKGYQNTRWYFEADTDDGERTFKSQRVMRLKDQWTDTTYDTSKEIRNHILSAHNISEIIFDDEE